MVEGQLLEGGREGLIVPTIEVHAVQKLHRQSIILGWVNDQWEGLLVEE